MAARIYPRADAKTQWWEGSFDRGTFSRIEKILLHTTETTGWPGYASGTMAPTLTYHPRLRAWRQHNYVDRSARALADSAATLVRENRDNVIQIEIIAYSDEPMGRRVGGIPVSELTDEQLGDIADFIRWVRNEYGGPPLVVPKFLPYPQSYGATSVRMSGPEYDAFRGILGHQHAPLQGHGDPGSLNVARIIELAGDGTPTPAPPEDDMFSDADRALLQGLQDVLKKADGTTLRNDLAAVKAAVDKTLTKSDGATLRNDLKWQNEQAAKFAGQVAGLTAAIQSLAGGQDVDLDAVTAAAKAGAQAALDEKIAGATTTLAVSPPE